MIAGFNLVVLLCHSGFYRRARSPLDGFRPYTRFAEEPGEAKLAKMPECPKLPSLKVGASSVNFTLVVHVFTTEHGAI